MKLKDKIDAEIKSAMLSKNADRLKALRNIKSLIMVAETENGKTGELNEERELAVLQKAAKQRKESIDIFKTNSREELADAELKELLIIEEFLPKQMSDNEIMERVLLIILEGGYTGIKSIGLVIKEFNTKFPGQDGKQVSRWIKSVLDPITII
jgi:uncharacterized protein YqeY